MSFQTYASRPLACPNAAAESCARLGLPTDWLAAGPNSYTNPLGCRTGRGAVLMRRADLDAVDLDGAHDLALGLAAGEVHGGATGRHAVTLKNLHVTLARSITPGLRDDPDSTYLVELADRRRLLRARPLNAAYNVRRSPDASDYFSATTDGGTPWTWQGVVSDLWTAAGLTASADALPFTPDGTPECLAFHGWYALDALEVVLDRLGCALKLDLFTDTFSVVRVGAADATADAALAAADAVRHLDDYFVEPDLGRYPEYVRVHFLRWRPYPDATGGSPYYTLDVADPEGTPPGALAGSYAVLFDELPATYDSAGSLTNSSDLAARAAERAADFFRQVRRDRLRRLYAVPLDAAGLRPGARITAERHGDRGRGLVTEVLTYPGTLGGDVMAPAYPVGGTGGGSAGDVFVAGGGPGNVTNVFAPAGPSGGGGGGTSVWMQGGPSSTTILQNNPAYLLQYLSQYLTATDLTFSGVVQLCGPAARCVGTQTISTNQNNYQFSTSSSVQEIETTTNVTITGIVPETTDRPYELTIINPPTSTGTITFPDESGSSTTSYRFDLPDDVPSIVLPPGTSTVFIYDPTGPRWRPRPTLPTFPWRPTLTGTNNDLPPPFFTVALIPDLTSLTTITGLKNLPVGVPFTIANPPSNSYDLTLANNSGSSSVGNRFDFSTGADVTLSPGESLTVVYDGSKIVDAGSSLSLSSGTPYTDEAAQDAVGGILADTDTVDATYSDGTPSITFDVRKQMSVTSDASGLKLVGDSSSPGNSKLYGTDGSGNKGWYSQPSGSSTTSTNGSSTLGSPYTLTSSTAGSGLSVTLPAAGTYLVTCSYVVKMQDNSTATTVDVKLRNTSDSSDVLGPWQATQTQVSNQQVSAQGNLSALVTTSGTNKVVELYAHYTSLGSLPSGQVADGKMSYVRLS